MVARRINPVLLGEATSDITKRRAVMTLLVTVTVFIGLNTSLNHLGVPFIWAHRLIRTQFGSLAGMDSAPDILIFGDSSGLYGVQPDVLTEVLNVSTRNVCTLNFVTPYSDVAFLERFLSETGTPRIVVFVYAIGSFEQRQRFREVRYLGLGFSYYFPLLRRMSFKEMKESLLRGSCRLYAEKAAFTSLFQKPWAFDDAAKIRRFFLDYWSESGSLVVPPEDQDPAKIHRERRKFDAFYADGVQISTAAELGLRRIAQLSRQQRLPVFLAYGPIDSIYADQQVFRDYLEEYTDYLQRLTADEPYLHMLLPEPVYLPESDLYNTPMHPSVHGARQYSARLAAQIDSACASLGIILSGMDTRR